MKLVLNQTDVGRKVLTDDRYIMQLYNYLREGADVPDTTSIDFTNSDDDQDTVCLTTNIDYLVSCIEMNLAQEYKVINFDFYNDWVNGTIYIPRWMRFVRGKSSFLWNGIKLRGLLRVV